MIVMKIEGLSGVMELLDGKHIAKGVRLGLGKVGNSVRTVASTKIREEYNLKKSDVDKTFMVLAMPDHVIVRSQGRPINLTYFNARQYGSRNGKRVTTRRKGQTLATSVRGKSGSFAGVAVQIRKSSTTLLPGAFLDKVKAGKRGGFNIGVFKRKGKQRLPLINKAMITVPSMFVGAKVLPAIEEYLGSGKAAATVAHEIEQALARAAGPPRT